MPDVNHKWREQLAPGSNGPAPTGFQICKRCALERDNRMPHRPSYRTNDKARTWVASREVPPCDTRPKSERDKDVKPAMREVEMVTMPKTVTIKVKGEPPVLMPRKVSMTEAEWAKLDALAIAKSGNGPVSSNDCLRRFVQTCQPEGSGWRHPATKKS